MKPHEIIKNFRKKTGLKQHILAGIIKTGRGNYGRKENGKVPFTADEFFLVIDFFKNYISKDEYLNAIAELFGTQYKYFKDKAASNFSIKAENEQLVGDLLHDIILNPLGLNFKSAEEFAKKIDIPVWKINQILNSAEPPSWDLLKKMFCEFGININFLLSGNKSDKMGAHPDCWPPSYIDRIGIVLGIEDDSKLAAFLKIRLKDVDKIRKNPDIAMPSAIRNIITKAGIPHHWITGGQYPSHTFRNTNKNDIVPLGPAIKILQEFFQKEKKEIVMKKAWPLIQLVRELLSENNNSEQQEFIKKFNDQKAEKEANEWLLKLEKLDIEEFYLAIAMIKGKVIKREQSIYQKKTGTNIN